MDARIVFLAVTKKIGNPDVRTFRFQNINLEYDNIMCDGARYSFCNYLFSQLKDTSLNYSIFLCTRFNNDVQFNGSEFKNAFFLCCSTNDKQAITRAWLESRGIAATDAVITNIEELNHAISSNRITAAQVAKWSTELNFVISFVKALRTDLKDKIKPDDIFSLYAKDEYLQKLESARSKLIEAYKKPAALREKQTDDLKTLDSLIANNQCPENFTLNLDLKSKDLLMTAPRFEFLVINRVNGGLAALLRNANFPANLCINLSHILDCHLEILISALKERKNHHLNGLKINISDSDLKPELRHQLDELLKPAPRMHPLI